MKIYPPDLLQALDFPFVRQQLSRYCSSAKAKERALDLQPIDREAELRERLSECDEILALLLSEERFPSAEHPPVEFFLARLSIRGMALKEKEFADLRSLALQYQNLYRYVELKRDRLPSLWWKMAGAQPLEEVVRAIDKVLDERAEVRSEASPELARIRRDLSRSRSRADQLFNRALKKYRDQGIVSDFDESVSDQRRVLAIQASYKNQVQGIYHSSSQKHSIAFIEPGETVEINNYIAELLEAEREEIKRILLALGQSLAPFREDLALRESLLQWLDLRRATALYAQAEQACVPLLAPEPSIKLRDAYNPVLRHYNREKAKDTVALSLQLDQKQRFLVISGPNAGGKSLSLKTVGLLQVMLQSGLPIPVHPESELGLFEELMGDIGDAQSIENELSTYSSKLQKMEYFLREAQPHSLLLIDEFGSGSDPDLGSALAQVFLDRLHQFGCFGIATTHFNAIKALAAQKEGIINGAMRFDRVHFEPQYQLEMGQPGSSFTFEVAQRSGIAAHLISEARANTDRQTLAVDQLLVKLQAEQQNLLEMRQQQRVELERLQALQSQQRQSIAKLEAKLAQQREHNLQTERSLYWGQRFEKLVDQWMNQQSQKDKKAVVARFIALLNLKAGEKEKTEGEQHVKALGAHQKALARYQQEDLAPGTSVKILDSGLQGQLLQAKGDKFLIALGGNMTALMERSKFVRADAPIGPKPKKKKRAKQFSPRKSPDAPQKPSARSNSEGADKPSEPETKKQSTASAKEGEAKQKKKRPAPQAKPKTRSKRSAKDSQEAPAPPAKPDKPSS